MNLIVTNLVIYLKVGIFANFIILFLNKKELPMKNLKLTFFLMPILILQYGCTNDSTSDLIDLTTDGDITYTNAVKSIIENNCIFCHTLPPQNGAPMSLTTYADVKNAVLNRGLLDRISRPQGASGMMPSGGARLPQTTIDKISQWAENGFPE